MCSLHSGHKLTLFRCISYLYPSHPVLQEESDYQHERLGFLLEQQEERYLRNIDILILMPSIMFCSDYIEQDSYFEFLTSQQKQQQHPH